MPAASLPTLLQRAMEVAGMSDNRDEDDSLPELRAHMRLDKHLRRLYKHAEEYRKAAEYTWS